MKKTLSEFPPSSWTSVFLHLLGVFTLLFTLYFLYETHDDRRSPLADEKWWTLVGTLIGSWISIHIVAEFIQKTWNIEHYLSHIAYNLDSSEYEYNVKLPKLNEKERSKSEKGLQTTLEASDINSKYEPKPKGLGGPL